MKYRRRLHRRERKHRNKVIVISLVGLVLLLSCAYVTFQTSISLTAKGNIKGKYGIDITQDVVTTGDGLYLDTYETDGDRYVYKGSKPLLLK